jgi:hypothetical protein
VSGSRAVRSHDVATQKALVVACAPHVPCPLAAWHDKALAPGGSCAAITEMRILCVAAK